MKSTCLLCILTIVCCLAASCSKNSTNSSSPPTNGNSPSGSAPASATAGGDTNGGAGGATDQHDGAQGRSGGGASTNNTAAAEPVVIIIPAGKVLTIRLSQPLSSKGSEAGETFLGTLAEPIEVNGQPVIERGATVRGTVVNAKAMGHFKGGALLQLKLNSVTIKGQEYPVHTRLWSEELKGKGKRSAIAIGGGAGVGAALGGIFGGGKGAAIGALAGGGAGTAGAAYTGNKEIELPAESAVRFRLTQSLEVS